MKLETPFQVCNLCCQFGSQSVSRGQRKPLLEIKELAPAPLRDVATTLACVVGVLASGAGSGGPGLGRS